MSAQRRMLALVVVVLTCVGLTGLVAAPASAAPVVSSFTPASGGVGKPVTITGTGFTAVTAVKFNGTPATYTVVSGTQISTSVPPSATTGKISVTAGGVTGASSTNFTVTIGAAVSPNAGPPGTRVVVSGSGFGANEAVDLYVGTSDEALLVADGNGNVSAAVTVSSFARPGPYWFTLIGRRTGNAAQTAFTVRTNLLQAGVGPGKTSNNPTETVIGGQDLDLAWSKPGGVPPAVVNGLVITIDTDTNSVVAYSTDGALKWTRPLLNLSRQTPAVIGNTVVVGGTNGTVRGLSLTTGAVQWTRALATASSIAAPVTVTASAIYAVQVNGHLAALTAAGVVLWEKTMSSTATAAQGAAVSTAAGLVVTADDNGVYYAWTTASGGSRWTHGIGSTGAGAATPVISGNLVIATASGNATALNLTNGSNDWSTSLDGAGATTPTAGNGLIFFAGHPTTALNRSTGTTAWTGPDSFSPGGSFLANGFLWVVGPSAQYLCLSAYGGSVASSVGGYGLKQPEVVDGQLYTISSNPDTLNVFTPPDPANPSRGRPDPAALHPDRSLKARR